MPKEPIPPPPKYEEPPENVANAIELESERVDPGGFFLTEEGGYESKKNEYERIVEERRAAAADYQSAPQPEIRQTADVYLDPDTNPMPL